MLHGSPARPAHRTSSGGPGLLVRRPGRSATGRPARPATSRPGLSATGPPARPATGQHRVPQQRRTRRTPREPERAMHLLMTGLGAVILLAICGLSGFFVIADDRRGVGAQASSSAAAASRTLSSRQGDATPLTVAEVFGDREIHLTPGAAPYTVALTHIDRDCRVAASGETRGLLDRYGCSQVVRAALTSPYGGYRVTAGVFNLTDEVGAVRMAEQIRPLVETGDGGFPPLAPDAVPGAEPEPEPAAQVGWQEYGHYLVYCVIAAPDGRLVGADDPYARRITTDVLETYLGGTVLGARG